MDKLREKVKSTVAWYAGGGPNLRTFVLSDDAKNIFTAVVIDTPIHRRPAAILVMARIEGEHVIIEADTTDRPLEDALVRAGIPREKIILAHAGESLPGVSQS
jgi:hypothetical protein